MAIIIKDDKIRYLQLTGDEISLIVEEVKRMPYIIYTDFGWSKIVKKLEDGRDKQDNLIETLEKKRKYWENKFKKLEEKWKEQLKI